MQASSRKRRQASRHRDCEQQEERQYQQRQWASHSRGKWDHGRGGRRGMSIMLVMFMVWGSAMVFGRSMTPAEKTAPGTA